MATTRHDFGTVRGLIDGAHPVLWRQLWCRLLHRRVVTAPRLSRIDSRPYRRDLTERDNLLIYYAEHGVLGAAGDAP